MTNGCFVPVNCHLGWAMGARGWLVVRGLGRTMGQIASLLAGLGPPAAPCRTRNAWLVMRIVAFVFTSRCRDRTMEYTR